MKLEQDKQKNIASTASPGDKWTSEVSVLPEDASAVITTLKFVFPARAADLDDKQNLEVEFVPAYNSNRCLGEESWVLYNTRTNREFLLVYANPKKSVRGFYRRVAMTKW